MQVCTPQHYCVEVRGQLVELVPSFALTLVPGIELGHLGLYVKCFARWAISLALVQDYFSVSTPKCSSHSSSYFSKLSCKSACLHHTVQGSLLTTRRSYCLNNVHQLESCTGNSKSLGHIPRPWEHSHRHGQSSVALSGVTVIHFVWFSFHQVMPFTPTILALSWNLTNSLSPNPHSITRRRIPFWNLLRAL